LDVSEAEWELLGWLSELLFPFAEVTREVESETVPAVHRVVPWHRVLGRLLSEAGSGAPSEEVAAAVDSGAAKLAAYGSPTLSDAFFVATVLDPRRRLAYFRDAGGRSVEEVRFFCFKFAGR
jgi:hypothetical protein